MRWRTAIEVLRGGQTRTLLRALRLATPFYRLAWLVTAFREGLLLRLARKPASLDELASEMEIDAADHDWLRAWLELGLRLRELRLVRGRYEPRGYFQDGETLESPLLAGFELPVRGIFA